MADNVQDAPADGPDEPQQSDKHITQQDYDKLQSENEKLKEQLRTL